MITAIIPARGGSKGIPKKNITNLGGHPLIAYSIAACQLAYNIDRIIVSTDDEEIAKIASAYGAEIPFLRPANLAQDSSTDVGFLKHFFDHVNEEEAALIRPTAPLRNPAFMDHVIEKYFTIKEKISGLRSIEETHANPYKIYQLHNNILGGFFMDFQGQKDYHNLPRQVFPKAYAPNSYIDIVKKKTISQGSTFGDRIHGEVSEQIIDIDSPSDLKLAQYAAQEERLLVNFLKNKKTNT